MNFCPQCGASLPGGAVSFCPQCGEALPQDGAVKSTPKKSPSKKKPAARGPRRKPVGHRSAQKVRPAQNPMDENYDGYYDDVPPIDTGWDSGGMDPDLIKRVVILVLGAVCLIGLAIVLMTLL